MAEREERSRFEDEGIPDLQDGTPQQQWAQDPQEMPLPGDRPTAVDDFGTTGEEQRAGESLDGRLARERPEVIEAANVPEDPDSPWGPGSQEAEQAGRLMDQDAELRNPTNADDEADAVARDVGPDSGGFTAEEDAVRIQPE